MISRLELQQANTANSLPGEPKTGMISRLELQQATTALTDWRVKDSMISRLELQQATTGTHFLKSQGQA